MTAPPPPDVAAFVRGALPDPPARVLEIGAGSGALAALLRDGGYDVLAIDPAADGAGVEALALLDVDEPAGSFDAAVAVVSLHHVEPLGESLRRLADLLRPGAVLAVDEFAVERLDERAAAWWLAQRAAAGDGHDGHEPAGPAELVAAMRGHIHPVSLVAAELERDFTVGPSRPGPVPAPLEPRPVAAAGRGAADRRRGDPGDRRAARRDRGR